MSQIEYHKKKSLSPKWILGGLMIAILMIASSILFLLYPFASKERATYFTDKNPILFEGSQQGNALIEGDSIFLPLSFMQEHIDDTIIFDEKSKSIIITTSEKVIQMPTDSLTFFVNQKPVELQVSPLITKEGQIFVAIDPLLSYYPIQYKILEDTGAIWIQKNGDRYFQGEITAEDVHQEKMRLTNRAILKGTLHSRNI